MKIHVQCLVQNLTQTGCLISVSLPLPVSGSYHVPTETLSLALWFLPLVFLLLCLCSQPARALEAASLKGQV